MRGVRRRDESGFTLIELMFSMVLFGILVGIAAGPWASYRAKQEHLGSARETVAFLRRAQVRAVSEETTYRVDFAADGRTVTAYRWDGTTFKAGQVLKTPSSRITFSGASFMDDKGANSTSAYFYARGSGSKGSVTVVREGGKRTYSINVEGLTARVSYQ